MKLALLVNLVALLLALSTSGRTSAQQPLWANDLVPKQPPARNAVPGKDDPALPTDNGSDSLVQEELRRLARIADDQTYQDTGDPVVPTIGMVSHRATDLLIAGRGIDFSFERRYSSHDSAIDGPLGFGWDHCYNARLQVNNGGAQVIVNNGNGRQDVYVWTAQNSPIYLSPPGVYTLLKYEAPSQFVLRNREGTKTYFSADSLRMSRIQDAAGNSIEFFYDAAGRLDYVVDTMGRAIDFSYNGQGRLAWIQDFRGRRVVYYYQTNGDLSGVRTPTVTSTNGFNDFSTGRIEGYTYLDAPSGLPHKLSSIVRPNDVTQSTPPYGTPSVQFQYDMDPNSTFWGWCVAQVLGGSNAAGSAGGTILYDHEALDSTTSIYNADALSLGRLRARVTDRREFVTDYIVNQNGHVIEVIDYEGATTHTTLNEYNADGELVKITQPRGNYTTLQYSQGFRLTDGSVNNITHHSASIASDQATRTRWIEYEPIFGNVIREADFNGNVTSYKVDYQEGEGIQGSPDDVIAALRADLLNIYTYPQVAGLLALFNIDLEHYDLNGDGLQPIAKGRVIVVQPPITVIPGLGGAPLALLEGDVYQEAWLTRTFNQYGQLTSETDQEENVTIYLYYAAVDPDGDGVPTVGTGLDPNTGGYLRRIVGDTVLPYADPQVAGISARDWDIGRNSGTVPTAVNKITDYLYDPSGNLVSVTDTRGVTDEYFVNELDERWKVRRGASVAAAANRAGGINGTNEDLTGQAFGYEELWRFDKNGNVVAHFTQNSGGYPDAIAVPGAPASHWEEYWTYDILNNVRTEKREYGFAGEIATWTYTYDLNENRSSVSQPEGNATAFTWDFRGQMKSVTRGAGSSDASQATFYYDSNGNLLQSSDGRGKHTQIETDGFNRVVRVVKPVGSEGKFTYDAQSNIVQTLELGHPGGPSPSNNNTSLNIQLRRITNSYDQRNRLIRVDREDPQVPLLDGALTPNDGKVSTVFNYDRLDRVVYVIDDDTSKTETLYDGANRSIKETDPVGNIVEARFDDNDNLVKIVDRDIYPNAAYRDFETYRVVDSLNRIQSSTDNIGRTERFTYDSRGYVVHRSDGVASLLGQHINGRQINGPGNTTSIRIDGFGRVLTEESDLRVGGTGDGPIDAPQYNPDGRSTRTFVYDKNSRLRYATDDTGRTTEYQYDPLDRLRTIVFADNTQFTQHYDRSDNVIFWQDAVGSQAVLAYDDQNRLTDVDASIPSTVVGSTKLRYEYDGLGRQTGSTDSIDSTLGANDWVNEYTWDAIDRLKTQVQNGRTVTSTWREEAKKNSLAHPSGVTVQYGYDAIERATTVTQGVQLASFWYAGTNRLLQRTDYAGVTQRYHDGTWNDTNYYDGARRPVKLEFRQGAALLTGVEHGFDRANNRLYTRRVHNNSRGDNFIYDSLYRLGSWERDVPAAAVGVPGGNSFDARHAFFLDGAHSRRKTTKQTSGSQIPVPTVITVDDVHNYVTRERGLGPQFTTWNQAFDLNGNKTAFTDQGTRPTYKYDFLNRLRVIEQGVQKVEFDYDAENRRVRTKVTGLTGYPAVTEFVHDGEHVIEEFDGSGTCLRRFYYADELDELVGYENLAFYPGPGAYFCEQDSAGDVVAIHDQGGNVVERYTYGAFGSVFFETAGNVAKPVTVSDYGNPCNARGLRYENYFDALYYVRARFLDCTDGAFMQRDPIGVWGDDGNVGNPKAYVAGNPINGWDPLGLNDWWEKGRTPGQKSCMECHGSPAALSQGVTGADKYGTKATATFYKWMTIGTIGVAGGLVCGQALATAASKAPPAPPSVAPRPGTPVGSGPGTPGATGRSGGSQTAKPADGKGPTGGQATPPKNPKPKGEPHSKQQKALKELADEASKGNKPISPEDADVLRRWRDEYWPGRSFGDDFTPKPGNHWTGGPHIHIPGSGSHTPVGPG